MSKIKICGLTRTEDIAAANRALPDYVGFVFAQSRRRVDVKTAAVLKEKLRPDIKAVGVFVNEDIAAISEIYRSGIIDLAQLHGDEDDGYVMRLKNACGCEVIKAVGVRNGIGERLPPLPVEPDYVLFDTISVQRGGTGKTFDWSLLKNHCGSPYFLAGGLSLENVGHALDMLSPFCVDVSSGVETDGIKDADKMKKFVNAVRRKTNE